MRRVEISGQVRNFVRSRVPDPRRQLRLALRELARERGDVKALEGPLKDFFRLRVRDYRIIFRYSPSGKVIHCIFAERRELIYELFEKLIHSLLLSEPKAKGGRKTELQEPWERSKLK